MTVVRTIPLGGRAGSPFAIVATPQGFACLIRDKEDAHYLYLLHCNRFAFPFFQFVIRVMVKIQIRILKENAQLS